MVRSGVDYATDQVTVYRSCPYRCVYCWAWRIPLFSSRISRGRYDPVMEASKYLRRSNRVIVVSFTSDPYPPIEIGKGLTREVLKVLSRNPENKVLILTKNPGLALRDLDLMLKHRDMWLGTTVTTLNDDVARKIEPNAPLPYMRLEALRTAHERGVRTWLSVEPIIPHITYPEDIVKETIGFIDWYVLGAFNYSGRINIPGHGKVTKGELRVWYLKHIPKTVEILKRSGKQYFIKKELLKYLT